MLEYFAKGPWSRVAACFAEQRLRLVFYCVLKQKNSVKGTICQNFSCSVGVRSGMFFENFQEEFLRGFL